MLASTGRIYGTWRQSCLASLLALSLAGGGCTGKSPADGTPARGSEVQAAIQGWMGRYARRDPAIGRILREQRGWLHYRRMELFEAIQAFNPEAGASPGLVRTYLEFADLYASLDRVFLETEAAYLAGAVTRGPPRLRARKGWVALRQGRLDAAREVFEREDPSLPRYPAALGRAGIAYLEGDTDRLRALARQTPPPENDSEKVLGLVACYLWGVPCPTGDRTPYGLALDAFRQGNLGAGVMALQMVDFDRVGDGPEPDLYLYLLLARGFAALARTAAESAHIPFWAARAYDQEGKTPEAAQRYALAEKPSGAGPEPWLFSPIHGSGESVWIARVLRGRALYDTGRRADALALWRSVVAGSPGPLALALLAQAQAETRAGAPLGNPEMTARAALREVRQAAAQLPPDPEPSVADLYGVRVAAVARAVARVLWASGKDREALSVLEEAHRKARGYRPDFVNTPAFLVDLARAYARTGQYAPAVAVLFSLTEEYPSVRVAYESLKRLYASRTGGGVPPR